MLEEQFATAQKRQEALQVEIKTIQTSWADYYAMAIEDIKQRFAEIDKTTFTQYLTRQKAENEKIESELAEILGQVQALESEISTKTEKKSKDGQDTEHLHKLKQQAEEKQIRFRTLLNRKSVMYAELLMNARILMDMND